MSRALSFVLAGLRTLRTPWLVCVIAVLVGVGACLLSAVLFTGTKPLSDGEAASAITALASEVSFSVPGLMLGVLGVLASAQEYSFGLIQTSLTAVPRRGRLIAAKVIVLGGLAAMTGLCSVALNSVIVLTFPNLDTSQLHWAGSLGSALLGYIALNVFYMLFGLALGGLLRSVPAAAVAVTLWPMMLEPVIDMSVKLLPVPDFIANIGQVLPFTAARAMVSVDGPSEFIHLPLSPVAGALVATIWLVFLYAWWKISFSRRDT